MHSKFIFFSSFEAVFDVLLVRGAKSTASEHVLGC